MNLFTIIILFFFVIAFELIYFKVADKYSIIDHPHHRSSHDKITIRGGGIIFPLGFLVNALYFNWEYGYFVTGLLLISFISFVDDVKPAKKRIRILFHVTAIAFL